MCEVPAQNNSLSRYGMPVQLLELLKLFDGLRETKEVIDYYLTQHPGDLTEDKIEKLINTFFVPKTLLIDKNDSTPLPRPSATPNSYLYIKARLLSHKAVVPVARLLSPLFKKTIVIAWLPVFIAAHFVFYVRAVSSYDFNVNNLAGPDLFVVIVVTIAASMFHELGHASALIFYGCKRTEIGVGIYLVFPVLYTDVSECWRLRSKQRAVVDIAGIYFHLISLVVLLIVWEITRIPSLLFCFFFIDATIASSLNPFLRMDGYWMVTDLFGISNLQKHSLALLKNHALKIVFPNRKRIAPRLNLTPTATTALGVYSVVSAAFFLYIFKILFFQLVFNLIPAYPNLLLNLWEVVQAHPTNVMKIVGKLFETLWKTAVLFGFSMVLYRVFFLRPLRALLHLEKKNVIDRLRLKWRADYN